MPLLTLCTFCNQLPTTGEACPRCLPLVVRPRRPPDSGQLLAERYDLPAIAREAFPNGAAP